MPKIVKSLAATWYHAQPFFEREQREVFARHWTFIASEKDLSESGQYVVADIAGRSVVVVRNGEGVIKGFYNLCRHRAAGLCSGESGKVGLFRCPYHSWSYDLDGALKVAPGFEFDEEMRGQLGLLPIRVGVWNGLVFACLDWGCESLEEWLGDIREIAKDFPPIEGFEFYRMLENDGGINWKTYSDNSAEGYHLASVHPNLNRALVESKTQIKTYDNGLFVGFDVTYRDEADGSNGGRGFWVYKFPGLLLHFSMRSFNIERIIPFGPRKTRMRRWFWFDPSVSSSEREETVRFSNEVMDQDVGICVSVQANLEGGQYETGYLSEDLEPGTIFFQTCLREALAGESGC